MTKQNFMIVMYNMSEFDVNSILTSFEKFEKVCGDKLIAKDEERFTSSTSGIQFHLIEDFISNDAGLLTVLTNS